MYFNYKQYYYTDFLFYTDLLYRDSGLSGIRRCIWAWLGWDLCYGFRISTWADPTPSWRIDHDAETGFDNGGGCW